MPELLPVDVCQKKLRLFVEQVCHGQSPLYEFVCPRIADDPQLLERMRLSPLEQPGPNLFLGAIHFLLLAGDPHELREFYATCSDSPRLPNESWPAFRDFCLTHDPEIAAILATHRVQTNEVRRCSYLFPAYSQIHSLAPELPLAIIEVGASAGLNLNWDRYAYDYGSAGVFGDPSSPVLIRCECRSPLPQLPMTMPPVAYRWGIDLYPIDLNDARQALWLQALVWPDQPDRFRLQQAAIAEFRRSPVELVAGNALNILPAEISKIPADAQLCIVHSHTLNQFNREERAQFAKILQAASENRMIKVISAEWIGTPTTELRIANIQRGIANDQLCARVDHHGRWLEWC